MKPGDLVRVKDVQSYQRYRTRYWKQHGGKMPPFMPSLKAVFKVNRVWNETWQKKLTPVAGIQQVEPKQGLGLGFIIPQDFLVIVEEAPEPEVEPAPENPE